MKTINAANAPISSSMLRAATSGYALAKCRLHPAQLAAFEMLATATIEIIKQQLEDDGEMPDLHAPPPHTIAGIPVDLDLEFPMTRIQFLDEAGVAITEIECLPIPSGFWPA